MKFTYCLIRDADGWLAECAETDAAGEGKTSQEAVESLRTMLRERMFRPDAVAPPSNGETTETGSVELELASEQAQRRAPDASGPGG